MGRGRAGRAGPEVSPLPDVAGGLCHVGQVVESLSLQISFCRAEMMLFPASKMLSNFRTIYIVR